MKKSISLLILPVFLISILGLISSTSCKNNAKKEQKKFELSQADTLKGEIAKNVYPMPTSVEVIKMLSDLEVGYIFGISNPVENTKKYFNQKSKAINMGVFGADLSYATLYNQNQEVINYLDAIRALVSELNMSKIYDQTLYEKIVGNEDNKDALVEILKNAFDETYRYLVDNEQEPLALMVVGGAWVEGMYLTTHVSEAAYQIAGISKNLLEQKKSFQIYLDITKPFVNDPMVSDMLKKLEPIKAVYDRLGTSLTNQDIMDITKAIGGIREQIVQ